MITLVGCGTLGSRVAALLSTQPLTLIDHDLVHPENMDRQGFSKKERGMHKAKALAARCTQARAHTLFLDNRTIGVLREASVVVDCTDNLVTRELLGQYCYREGIPLVHGAAGPQRGISTLLYGRPCMASLYAGKIAVDTCRGRDIDPRLAARIAAVQARLVLRAMTDQGHDGVYILTADTEECVQVSTEAYTVCDEAPAHEGFSLTICTTTGQFTAIPNQPRAMQPRTGKDQDILYRVRANGTILFHGTPDIDALRRVAKTLYERYNSL